MPPEMVRGGTKTESQFIVKLKTNAVRTDERTDRHTKGWTDQTLKDKRKDGTDIYIPSKDRCTDGHFQRIELHTRICVTQKIITKSY